MGVLLHRRRIPEIVRWIIAEVEHFLPSLAGLNEPALQHPYATPTNGDPVDLSTGRETELPPVDLKVYNPIGPPVQFQRAYYGGISDNIVSSPGISPAGVYNYDITIRLTLPGSWSSDMLLKYPKGAYELITPMWSCHRLSNRQFCY